MIAAFPAPTTGDAAVDAFSAGATLFAGVGTRQRGAPVVVVVDDLHWADVTSVRALAFFLPAVARRPGAGAAGDAAGRADPVRRELGAGAATQRVRWIRLGGLTACQVRELAAAGGWPLTGDAAAGLQEHTGGNPLYVTTLLTEGIADAPAGGP